MTTETDADCPFAIHAISYLRRNDFTKIKQLGFRLLTALDGSRPVFVWIAVLNSLEKGTIQTAIPTNLFTAAELVGGRVDVIWIKPAVPNGMIVMQHQMDVGSE